MLAFRFDLDRIALQTLGEIASPLPILLQHRIDPKPVLSLTDRFPYPGPADFRPSSELRDAVHSAKVTSIDEAEIWWAEGLSLDQIDAVKCLVPEYEERVAAYRLWSEMEQSQNWDRLTNAMVASEVLGEVGEIIHDWDDECLIGPRVFPDTCAKWWDEMLDIAAHAMRTVLRDIEAKAKNKDSDTLIRLRALLDPRNRLSHLYLQVLDGIRDLFRYRYVQISQATRDAQDLQLEQHMEQHRETYARLAQESTARHIAVEALIDHCHRGQQLTDEVIAKLIAGTGLVIASAPIRDLAPADVATSITEMVSAMSIQSMSTMPSQPIITPPTSGAPLEPAIAEEREDVRPAASTMETHRRLAEGIEQEEGAETDDVDRGKGSGDF